MTRALFHMEERCCGRCYIVCDAAKARLSPSDFQGTDKLTVTLRSLAAPGRG